MARQVVRSTPSTIVEGRGRPLPTVRAHAPRRRREPLQIFALKIDPDFLSATSVSSVDND